MAGSSLFGSCLILLLSHFIGLGAGLAAAALLLGGLLSASVALVRQAVSRVSVSVTAGRRSVSEVAQSQKSFDERLIADYQEIAQLLEMVRSGQRAHDRQFRALVRQLGEVELERDSLRAHFDGALTAVQADIGSRLGVLSSDDPTALPAELRRNLRLSRGSQKSLDQLTGELKSLRKDVADERLRMDDIVANGEAQRRAVSELIVAADLR